eukprot:TRINITY_DN5406_c0_g1_i1.p1 TRINITY_DN5406_c0_g1~~TRINITY_DN5406_c0_g1_i1.p1  ORF type:complete len:117 (+),score=13.66 TRINITY_DN5406_c0_g1_i1:660-1010(+)
METLEQHSYIPNTSVDMNLALQQTIVKGNDNNRTYSTTHPFYLPSVPSSPLSFRSYPLPCTHLQPHPSLPLRFFHFQLDFPPILPLLSCHQPHLDSYPPSPLSSSHTKNSQFFSMN